MKFLKKLFGFISNDTDISNNQTSATPPATVTPPTNTVASTPKSYTSSVAVLDPDKEERERHRAEYLRKKKEQFSLELNAIPKVEITLSEENVTKRKASDMPAIEFKNITRSTNIAKLFPLVVIDTETTGIQIRGNEIIEVSAIKYDVGFKPVSCFTTLIKPRKPIPPEATKINHITDEMVADCPSFSAILPAFAEYISGCNIVGHNIAYDLKFLFVNGLTLPEKVRYFDTLALAKKTLKLYNQKYDNYDECPEFDVYDYKLETLCNFYYIHRSDAHRSLSDCYATGKVFECLIDDKTE